MGLQIAITLGFFLSIFGFVYFLKPRSVVRAESKTSKDVPQENEEDNKQGGRFAWAKEFSSSMWARLWTNKEDDSKKLFLYIVAILIAYAVAGIAPAGKEVIWRGVAALIVLHFIWTFSPGKASKVTWAIVIGMLAYFVLAWVYPKDAPRILNASWEISKNVMGWAADGTESLAKGESGVLAGSAMASENKKFIKDVFYVTPTTSRTISAPPGYRLSSMNCPAVNAVDIIEPSTGKITRQLDCSMRTAFGSLMEYEILDKEFVIFQKEGGTRPSMVTITWVRV